MRAATIGHRIIHAGILSVALTRAIAYAPLAGGPHDSSGPLILSDGGRVLPFYAGLWAVTAVLAVVWGVRGRGVLAILAYVFLMGVWAVGYLVAWVSYGLVGPAWMSFFLYGGGATLAVGAYYLLDALNVRQGEQVTEALETIDPPEEEAREP